MASTMKSRQLTQPRWISMCSGTVRTDMLLKVISGHLYGVFICDMKAETLLLQILSAYVQ